MLCYLNINYVTVLKQLIQLCEAILPRTDDQIFDLNEDFNGSSTRKEVCKCFY